MEPAGTNKMSSPGNLLHKGTIYIRRSKKKGYSPNSKIALGSKKKRGCWMLTEDSNF